MSDGSIKSPSGSNNILNPLLVYVGTKTRIEFTGSCSRQDKILFDHEKLVNISIVYEINSNFQIGSYPTLENCFFWCSQTNKTF